MGYLWQRSSSCVMEFKLDALNYFNIEDHIHLFTKELK